MARRTVCLLATATFAVVLDSSLRSSTAAEVPFELYQRHLVVTKGAIGGLSGLNLLIDTGTIPSVVDRRIARKLGLHTGPATLVAFGERLPVHAAVLEGFRIGALTTGLVPSGVGDLSYLRDVRVDAIVGLDVLIRTSFTIDYRTRVMTFAPTAPGDATARLDVTWPFLTVRLAALTHEVRLLVDTGSPDLVLFATHAAAPLLSARGTGEKSVQYASGAARLRRLDLRDVRLGTDRWDALPAWMLDRAPEGYPPGIDGVLGIAALGCRFVRFDFDRSELGWSR